MRLEVLDESWAVWSSLSGETLQLNPEAASVLELLIEGQADPAQIAATLAADIGLSTDEVVGSLDPIWRQLIDAGLIEADVRPADAG
jgi:PqqD family protein of HPr-rel-A system